MRAFYAGCRELGRERFGRWPVDACADPSRVIGLRQTKAAQLGGLRERKACWRNWDDDQARVHDDLTPGRAGARNGVGSLGAFDSLRLARACSQRAAATMRRSKSLMGHQVTRPVAIERARALMKRGPPYLGQRVYRQQLRQPRLYHRPLIRVKHRRNMALSGSVSV